LALILDTNALSALAEGVPAATERLSGIARIFIPVEGVNTMTHKCFSNHAWLRMNPAVRCCLLCFCATYVQAVRPATIIEPEPGVFVAVADYSFYNYKDYSHVTQRSAAERIKKILDLTDLSDQDFASIESARVNIFMHAQDDEGDGLDGTFQVVVNGQTNTFPTEDLVSTGWGWFDNWLAINWVRLRHSREAARPWSE
jgi:hypothetical protein